MEFPTFMHRTYLFVNKTSFHIHTWRAILIFLPSGGDPSKLNQRKRRKVEPVTYSDQRVVIDLSWDEHMSDKVSSYNLSAILSLSFSSLFLDPSHFILFFQWRKSENSLINWVIVMAQISKLRGRFSYILRVLEVCHILHLKIKNRNDKFHIIPKKKKKWWKCVCVNMNRALSEIFGESKRLETLARMFTFHTLNRHTLNIKH